MNITVVLSRRFLSAHSQITDICGRAANHLQAAVAYVHAPWAQAPYSDAACATGNGTAPLATTLLV